MSQEFKMKSLKMNISRRPFVRPSVRAILHYLFSFFLYVFIINKMLSFNCCLVTVTSFCDVHVQCRQYALYINVHVLCKLYDNYIDTKFEKHHFYEKENVLIE